MRHTAHNFEAKQKKKVVQTNLNLVTPKTFLNRMCFLFQIKETLLKSNSSMRLLKFWLLEQSFLNSSCLIQDLSVISLI